MTMRTPHFPTLIALLTATAALMSTATGRADNATTTSASAPPSAFAPALTTPTRSTPLSASQTSATPVVGVETDTSSAGFTGWTKPAWLGDLSFGVKESYDDNLLRVSGKGLPTEASWVTVASLKLGLDLSSFVAADPGTIQSFSIIYQPDRAYYSQAPSADFTAHRVNTILNGKSGNLKFSFDDAFLYNDGNELAPTYALNQLSTAAADQND